MIVRAPKTDVKPPRSGDCGCGGPCRCESRCCDLECVVRPNFFCGQVLTDADLSAMVDWARTRFGLTRYRHGWGVACGLDVTCSPPGGGDDCCSDRGEGPHVYVTPGYAIDCCGNDLVVCEPMRVDLGDVCAPPDDACDPPVEPKRGEVPKTVTSTDPRKTFDPQVKTDVKREADDAVDCLRVFDEGLFAVNLTLRYHEDMAQGQRAMFRSGCSDAGSCEYSRVLERPCVHAEVGLLGCDDDDEHERWDREFTIRRTSAQREIAAALKLGPEATLKYLRRHPPHKLCFLEEFVCCVLGDERPTGKKEWTSGWTRLLRIWLHLDWLLHELECPCWSCRPDGGVPLGRLLLKRVQANGKTTCRVVFIDTTVPHRRPLRKDGCRPLPPGAIDLAPYLWQRSEELENLRALGVSVTVDTEGSRSTLDELAKRFENPRLTLMPGESRSLIALIAKDPFQCTRIAGFVEADNQ